MTGRRSTAVSMGVLVKLKDFTMDRPFSPPPPAE
jgi:hypothetical protein